jgi:hypothetical protein
MLRESTNPGAGPEPPQSKTEADHFRDGFAAGDDRRPNPMAMQTFTMDPARIAKYKGQILAHAVPLECLGRTGRQMPMPKNNSDTYHLPPLAALWRHRDLRLHPEPVLPERHG